MTVDLSFCYVIIYESWSVDELDFRCKLVLIQCNNRSGAHSFQKSLQQIKKTQVLSFLLKLQIIIYKKLEITLNN